MMSWLPHTVRDRLLVAYATGRLPAFVAQRVAARLATDVELAAAYDALCRLERMASGAHTTQSQRERLAAAILDAPAPSARRPRRGVLLGVMPMALAAATAALFFVVGDPLGDLTARGRAGEAPLGVKATCLSPDGAQVVDTATVGATRNADRLACPLGDLIAFATTNMGTSDRHVFIVGVTRSGERRWYEPFGEHTSALVPAGSVDNVLSPVADTRGMAAEPVTLHVLFSNQPIAARDVERALASAIDRGMAVGRAERIPVDVDVQARIEVSPTP